MSGAAEFRFLPWTRRGLVAELQNPDSGSLAPRAKLHVGVTVVGAGESGVDLTLYGPGDIVGVDPRLIVRTDPRPHATDVEPNYLPAIEFDPPDFPWMFTPAAGSGVRLRPWCVLVVLDTAVVDRPKVKAGQPLPEVTVGAGEVGTELPDLDESWAWAHTQLATSASSSAVDAELAAAPHRNVSRIVCPRRLQPSHHYMACLVPAFDVGVQRGLGEEDLLSMAGPAWSVHGGSEVRLPVYFHWEFATGPEGDFEILASRLRPMPCPPTLGYQPMFVGAGGPGLPEIPPGEAEAYLPMDGALRPPGGEATVDLEQVPSPVREALGSLLDAPARDAMERPEGAVGTLGPPIYGQWHANRHAVEGVDPGWLVQLNLDPRARGAAGLGAAVERANQEEFMHAAWEQVGAVLQANELLSRGWLAMDAGRRLHERHFTSLPVDRLLQVTAGLHGRVLLSPDGTVQRWIARSSLPDSAVDPALRRLTSGQRPMLKALARRTSIPTTASRSLRMTLLPSLAAGTTEVDPTGFIPDGILTWGFLEALDPPPGAGSVDLSPMGLSATLDRASFDVLLQKSRTVVTAHENRPPQLELGADAQAGVIVGVERQREAAPVIHVNSKDWVLVAFAGAFERLAKAVTLERRPPSFPLVPFDLDAARETLLESTDPKLVVPARLRAMISFSGVPLGDPVKGVTVSPTVDRIMVAPDLGAPVYTYLAKLNPERFLPGVGDVPSDSVTLLETNPRFVEAFLVGLNYEMNRELLWREYPTDQRGTPFRHFWEWTDGGADIEPIHTWSLGSDLGMHARGGPGGQLVLLLRGQLLRRYPNTVVYAVRAGSDGKLVDPPGPDDVRWPVFSGRFEPDLCFVGFDLSSDDLEQSPGWLFVLQEQPTEPRFGFDQPIPGQPLAALSSWSKCTWDHLAVEPGGHLLIAPLVENGDDLVPTSLGGVTFGADAAHMAALSLQKPVRVVLTARHLTES